MSLTNASKQVPDQISANAQRIVRVHVVRTVLKADRLGNQTSCVDPRRHEKDTDRKRHDDRKDDVIFMRIRVDKVRQHSWWRL